MTASIPATDELALTVEGHADVQTVDSEGRRLHRTIEGVLVEPVRPHIDARGMLAEVINFDNPFWTEPIVYSYTLAVRPGRTKGWAMHKRQADRHFLHVGRVRFVLFDARAASPTNGVVQVVNIGEEARALLRIPAGVWHAVQNIGDVEAHVTNFPTIPYDRSNPDKQLLPLDTDQIPFDFGDLDTYGR